jgi:hypothetical protein
VAAIAAGDTPSSGFVTGFYLIFDLIALVALTLYLVILVRVIRTREPGLTGRPWYRRLVTVWRELVVPVVILIRLPDVFGEPWRTLVRGDVGLVAALVTTIGLATMTARAFFAPRPSTPPRSDTAARDDLAPAGARR